MNCFWERSLPMATTWFRPQLSSQEQAVVLADRDHHPDPVVRTQMNVLWTVHLGYSRNDAAKIAHIGIATAERYILAYRNGGLSALTQRKAGPRAKSVLADHAELIAKSLADHPVRTTAEASKRIHELTGIRRGLTQTRKFLAGMGLKWQRTRAVPVPPKSY